MSDAKKLLRVIDLINKIVNDENIIESYSDGQKNLDDLKTQRIEVLQKLSSCGMSLKDKMELENNVRVFDIKITNATILKYSELDVKKILDGGSFDI